MIRRLSLCLALVLAPVAALAAPGFTFANIDGGTIDLTDWKGQPVLVVNTASRCGFTPQYDGLQALYDAYRDKGLVVLAVPSNDFRQELKTAGAVKEFCDANFGLTLPMADITHVKGARAHDFYKWVKAQTGFEPSWNFNKVLIAPDGSVAGTWGATTRPMSRPIIRKVDALLAAGKG